MQPSWLDGQLPVFVFPQSLTFYVADQSTHKQIVTLCNPYEFHISYSVLCNNPSCFTVDSPKGVVRAKCSLDIIITRINLSLSDASERDRFRILISEDGKRKTKYLSGNTGPSLLLVAAAVICLAGLLVPTEGDRTPSIIPSYMHLNPNIKIVVAYVLGLLTYAILRTG
nr:motile sperm domain-containing protein 1-like [Cherax quadricarinatus]